MLPGLAFNFIIASAAETKAGESMQGVGEEPASRKLFELEQPLSARNNTIAIVAASILFTFRSYLAKRQPRGRKAFVLEGVHSSKGTIVAMAYSAVAAPVSSRQALASVNLIISSPLY
jgi:hypothetical protein